MGLSREKQIQLAGWMLGDLNPYDKADRPSGNEFGHLHIRQEPQLCAASERTDD